MRVKLLLSVFMLNILIADGAVGEPVDMPNPGTAAIKVYRAPDCSCCHRWMEHLRQNGFKIDDNQTSRLKLIKQDLGIPAQLAACHTATIGGYIVEGHVPASDIRKLLTERPDIRGLSVPGMPIGSPGMEMGGQHDEYSVIGFDDSQQTIIYRHYPVR